MTYYTTLNKIRKHSPCQDGWKKLLRNLGKTSADDEPLSLVTILDSNGLEDAIWCIRACDDADREARLFAVWCARQVQHLMTDDRSLIALDVAERFANGSATQNELFDAWDAALVAERDAAVVAARDAAEVAAVVAARSEAWVAALVLVAARGSARKAQAGEFRRRFG